MFSIGVVFFAMITLTNLAGNFSSTGIIDFLFVYILGILFSFIVTYFIPRFMGVFWPCTRYAQNIIMLTDKNNEVMTKILEALKNRFKQR